MKRILYILLCCGLFMSCESDDDLGFSGRRIKSIEVTTNRSNELSYPNAKHAYSFQYDNQGRLKKVNDKEFTYGANGRVSASRVHRYSKMTYPEGIVETEYIEQLNYIWDQQGRLQSVVLDSLLQRYHDTTIGYIRFPPGDDDTPGASSSERVVKDVVLATYAYSGASSLPSSITYARLGDDFDSGTGIGEEEQVVFDQTEAVVHNSKQIFIPRLSPLEERWHAGPYPRYTIFSFYQYSDTEHYLYNLYRQLGFNPCKYWEVIPEKMISEQYVQVEEGDSEGTVQPDWANATKITSELDGKTETIKIVRVEDDMISQIPRTERVERIVVTYEE